MAFCPAGQHPQAKAGFGQAVQISTSGISALFNNIPTKWAVPLAAWLGSISYDLATLCDDDPPTLVTITADDVNALFQGNINPIAYIQAVAKFREFVKYYAWFQFCECTGGTTPAPTAGQAEPTGMPNVNVIAPAASNVCGLPAWTTVNLTPGSGNNNQAISVLGLDLQGVEVTMGDAIGSGSGGNVKFTWSWQDQLQSPLATVSPLWAFTLGPGLTVTRTLPVYPAGTHLFLRMDHVSGTGNAIASASGKFTCRSVSGAGGTQVTYDPSISAELDAILDLVTLIQRQHVPFAYIEGDVHSGVSGNGEITLQGVLGARIDFTTIPSRAGLDAGNPDERYGLGWIAWGDATGFSPREILHHDPQLSLPASAGLYTRLGYSIPADVTVTVTELIREA